MHIIWDIDYYALSSETEQGRTLSSVAGAYNRTISDFATATTATVMFCPRVPAAVFWEMEVMSARW